MTRRLFEQVAQSHQRPGARLNLVQKEQRLSRCNAAPEGDGELRQDRLATEISLENAVNIAALLQIDLHHLPEVSAPELLNGPGLTNLPSPSQNQWLTTACRLPLEQRRFD
jgi:hypothetical protein